MSENILSKQNISPQFSKWWILLIAMVGAVMYGVSAGLRGDIGILLMPIVNHSGQSYGAVSFVIAIMQFTDFSHMFREAFKNRNYWLLIGEFSTCGFHMVIIEAHLFSQYVSYGITREMAAWAFAVYGIATIAGALLSGLLSNYCDKCKLLGFYYGFRGIWVLLYLFVMPKTFVTAVLFSFGLGMTGDATVSPTSGLMQQIFRWKWIATLLGFLFLCHQIGAFLSAWIGGIFVDATGTYTVVWCLDVVVCLFASAVSFMIRDESLKTA